MPNPLLKRLRVVAAKVETTPGTAIALTGTDAFYSMDAKIESTIEVTKREDDGTLGQRTGVVGSQKGKATIKIYLKGSGTAGTSPHWALILLPGCGMVETAGVWTPTSATGSYKTLTIGVYENGLYKSICGAMGTATFEMESGKPVSVNFDFEGIWIPPTDVAMVTPEADTVKPPAFIGSTITLASAPAPVAKLTISQGNKVDVREDAQAASGYRYAVVTDRDYTVKLDPEATLVATRNVYNEFVTGEEQALSIAVGTVSGNIITFAGPKAQYKGINEGDRNQIVTHELDLQLNKNSGDDELSITF